MRPDRARGAGSGGRGASSHSGGQAPDRFRAAGERTGGQARNRSGAPGRSGYDNRRHGADSGYDNRRHGADSSAQRRTERRPASTEGRPRRPVPRNEHAAPSNWWEPGGSTAGSRNDSRANGPRQGAPRQGGSQAGTNRQPGRVPDGAQRTGRSTPGAGGRDRGGAPARRPSRPEEDYESTRGSRPTRGEEIAIPAGADPKLLDPSVRAELRSLSKLAAEFVGAHLVAAGQLIDTDPQKALEHARAARGRGARVAAVREATGLAAYHAGEWAEALSELRAARRISGDPATIAVMADCERALGRPERALKALDDPAVAKLDAGTRAELLIVVAGARRDLNQLDAALAVFERGGLDPDHPRPGSARLWYAYADALEAAGRTEEAIQWFGAAAKADIDDETDAADRAANLL